MNVSFSRAGSAAPVDAAPTGRRRDSFGPNLRRVIGIIGEPIWIAIDARPQLLVRATRNAQPPQRFSRRSTPRSHTLPKRRRLRKSCGDAESRRNAQAARSLIETDPCDREPLGIVVASQARFLRKPSQPAHLRVPAANNHSGRSQFVRARCWTTCLVRTCDSFFTSIDDVVSLIFTFHSAVASDPPNLSVRV